MNDDRPLDIGRPASMRRTKETATSTPVGTAVDVSSVGTELGTCELVCGHAEECLKADATENPVVRKEYSSCIHSRRQLEPQKLEKSVKSEDGQVISTFVGEAVGLAGQECRESDGSVRTKRRASDFRPCGRGGRLT